jgi:hypothetical protein
VGFDTGELDDLADDLGAVDIGNAIRPVMSKAGFNMKRGMIDDAPRGKHLPGYGKSLQYEIKDNGLAVEAGAKPEGQGLLSRSLEYGGVYSAPHPHIIPQLDKEAPIAEGFIVEAIEGAILGDT